LFLQLYDSTFEEYIDVEETDSVVDKAKLKVVQVCKQEAQQMLMLAEVCPLLACYNHMRAPGL